MVTVQAKGDASGTVTNSVSVSSTTTDPVTSNNTDDENTTITYNQTDLSITKVGPTDPVVRGSQFDYTITVLNSGPAVATNVIVTDTIPSDVSFVSATPIPDSGPYKIVWNLGSIQPGQSKVIDMTVYVEPWATEEFTNTVTTTTDTVETDYSNNDASATVFVPGGTAVTMTDFAVADIVQQKITIQWTVVNEIDIYGYKVYRSDVNDFSNSDFIHFEDATGDGTYTFTDTPPHNSMWYYWLTVVSNSGNESSPYGPLTASNNTLFLYFLPNLLR